jgi:hypothetical protein
MTNETKNTSGKTSIAGRKPRSGKSMVLAMGKRGANSIFTCASKSKEADSKVPRQACPDRSETEPARGISSKFIRSDYDSTFVRRLD